MGSQTSKISSLSLTSPEATRADKSKGAKAQTEKQRSCSEGFEFRASSTNKESKGNGDDDSDQAQDITNFDSKFALEKKAPKFHSTVTPGEHMITRSLRKNQCSPRNEEATCKSNSAKRRTIAKRTARHNCDFANTRKKTSEMRTRRGSTKRVKGSATVAIGTTLNENPASGAALSKREIKCHGSGMDNNSVITLSEHSDSRMELDKTSKNEVIPSYAIGNQGVNAQTSLTSFRGVVDPTCPPSHVATSFRQTPNFVDGSYRLQSCNIPTAPCKHDVRPQYFTHVSYHHGQNQPSFYQNWQANFGFLTGGRSFQSYTDQTVLQLLPSNYSSSRCEGNDEKGPGNSFTLKNDLGIGAAQEIVNPPIKESEGKADRAAHQARPANPRRKSSRGEESDFTNAKETLRVPLRRFSHGCEVHVVDEENKVFVVDLVQSQICDLIVKFADEHCANAEKNGNQGWRTLYTYSKMDLPCGEVAVVKDMVADIMRQVIKIVGDLYCDPKGAANLRPRSWKEPHLLKYQKGDGVMPHTGICEHYDGCDVTWQLMLTDVDDYEGGGTYFRSLKKTVKLRKGQVLIHPGELYHKGLDITQGVRELVVCFLDGFDPKIIDHSDPKESLPEHEKNVVLFSKAKCGR